MEKNPKEKIRNWTHKHRQRRSISKEEDSAFSNRLSEFVHRPLNLIVNRQIKKNGTSVQAIENLSLTIETL